MSIRVISGKYRHQKLLAPDPKITRPTIDRVKEAVFSILQDYLKGAIVLDLFAGSASLPIEALSRGAMKALIVDKNRDAISIIRQNLAKLKITNFELFWRDAVSFLQSKIGSQYDIIFLDPPHLDKVVLNQCLSIIAQNNFLKSSGLIVIETDDISKLIIPGPFTHFKLKKYGLTTILILSNK